MSDSISSSIIAVIFGICFFAIGIYALTHPKAILKKDTKSIEDPKYIGLEFICFAIGAAFFAANLYLGGPMLETNAFAQTFLSVLNTVGIIALSALFIIVGAIGLVKKRILIFKNTPAMKKYNQKFQKVSNINKIVFGLSFLFVFLGILYFPPLSNFVLDNPDSMIYFLLALAVVALPVFIIDVTIECSVGRTIKKK
jgi:hypothetical protein